MRPFVLVDRPLAEQPEGASIPLPAETRHHLTTVRRVRDGEVLDLSDGFGHRVRAELVDGDARLLAPTVFHPPPRPRLHVLQGLPKGRKVDDIVRVVTELGVDAVTLIAADRSVARPDARRAATLRTRLDAVARAAAGQARRHRLPVIGGPHPLAESVEAAGLAESADGAEPACRKLLVAHPGAPSLGRLDAAELRACDEITIAVGPEGGWSMDERDRVRDLGAREVGLGPTVLRTEHAAAAAVAVIAALTGRWDADNDESGHTA